MTRACLPGSLCLLGSGTMFYASDDETVADRKFTLARRSVGVFIAFSQRYDHVRDSVIFCLVLCSGGLGWVSSDRVTTNSW